MVIGASRRVEQLETIRQKLVSFLEKQQESASPDPGNKHFTYTNSDQYILYTTEWHYEACTRLFLSNLIDLIDCNETIIDVGCCSGFSGLSLALNHKFNVVFHDFEGLALSFIREVIKEWNFEQCSVVPYGEAIKVADWVLCLDVLEHTGNHLGTLKWLEQLSRKHIALTYPLTVPFEPPYVPSGLDEWVDDEAIQLVIKSRYKVQKSNIVNGRRYTIYDLP